MNLRFELFALLISLLCVNAIDTDKQRILEAIEDEDGIDSNWMSYLTNRNLYLHQYNIPGTHDSGTFNIPFYKSFLLETQSLNIMEQLKAGIRYLDIRITIDMKNGNNLYLSHEGHECRDSDDAKLYLTKVIETCIKFLEKHEKETIILHLKDEENDYGDMKKNISNEDAKDYIIGKLLARIIVENENYLDYIYIANEIPILNDVKKKIVIASRSEFYYGKPIPHEFVDGTFNIGENKTGIYIPIYSLDDCTKYKKDDIKCHPTIYYNFHSQDAYNLESYEKWILIYDDLTNNVNFKNYIGNDDKGEPMFTDLNYDNEVCTKFNDNSHNEVLSINFMNVARANGNILEKVADFLCDSSIENSAKYINAQLTKYIIAPNNIHNEWIVLDYPSIDVIRSIYRSNEPNNEYFNKNSFYINEDIIGWVDSKYYLSQKNPVNDFILGTFEKLEDNIIDPVLDAVDYVGEKVEDAADAVVNWFTGLFSKRSEQSNNISICLQREVINNKESITVGSECVKSSKNQWYIVRNDEFYNIVSVYDKKCIIYENNSLGITKCDKNNKNIDFTIKKGVICSRVDKYKCIFGIFEFSQTTLESKFYENLSCSTRFAKRGYNCCSNQNIPVAYVDSIGNWGIENGKYCGLGYKRCPFETIGSRCCSSFNTKVLRTDEHGSWGKENGEWCGIGELTITNARYRIQNVATSQCLITDQGDGTKIRLGECDDNSIWYINDNQFISGINNYCLNAINSKDSVLEVCKGSNEHVDHYKYFSIIDNKYICVKNNKETTHCLNADGLIFDKLNGEYSEWIIEGLESKVIDSIENINGIRIAEFQPVYNPDTFISQEFQPVSNPGTNISQETTNDCSPAIIEQGYPCCSEQNTEVQYTDEYGDWGYENDDWCGIRENRDSKPEINCSSAIIEQGFPCCSECIDIQYTDESGSWGYENDNWCGIPDTCSEDLRCGPENGNKVCPDNLCCSKYGYCGETEEHCIIECQSEFGKCGYTEPIGVSTDGTCGLINGMSCPKGLCCSKYGYCGNTEDHCGTGCQSIFGICN